MKREELKETKYQKKGKVQAVLLPSTVNLITLWTVSQMDLRNAWV